MTEGTKDPSHIDWLEKTIFDESITSYEYSSFKAIQSVGGNVYRATWKSGNNFFALKRFNNRKMTQKEFFNEVIA